MTTTKNLWCLIVVGYAMVSTLMTNAFADETALSIPAGDRAPLDAKLILPDGSGPFPILIIAPGQSYDMNQPLTAGLAETAAQAGFASIRFDWRFYTEDSTGPSDNVKTETADMKDVVSFARTDDRLDAERLFLAGKSMGSVVTYRVAKDYPNVRATTLLTPICRQLDENGENALYPGLVQTTKPIVLALGNQDPLCPLPNLYQWLGTANENIATLVFGGNHGMKLSSDDLTAQNEQKTIDAVVHWLTIHNQDLEDAQ